MKSTNTNGMNTALKNQAELFPRYPAIEQTTLRNAVRFYSTKCFSLPAPLSTQYFAKYYLLYWNGSYLLDQMQSGFVKHNGIAYSIEYKRGLTRGKILATLQNQFAISFRQPNIELDLPAIAIISETNRAKSNV